MSNRTLASETFAIRFDPRLVEAVVLEVAQAANFSEKNRFHRERDAIYEMEQADLRDASFQEFDARWFERLGAGRNLLHLVREHASLAGGISACYVLPAGSHKDEGADLHASKAETRDTAAPVLVIRLLPKTLVDAKRLTLLLRHELLHVTDMLDPGFAYEPALPDLAKGPMFQRLIQDRYRVLWSTSVDGRLAGAGRLLPHQVEGRRREFLEHFRMLGEDAAAVFQRFFNGARPTHREMVAFAVQPGFEDSNTRQCPLCQLPAPRAQAGVPELDARSLAAIRADFPRWEERQGLCLQCADLYRARAAL